MKCRGIMSLLFMLLVSCQSEVLHPDYATHIAPIIHRTCTPCHRPGQIAHFSLTTYEDVRSNAEKILFTVQNRLMPPWPADPHYTEFLGQNILTEQEIQWIQRWVEDKCPIGDSSKIPALPSYYSSSFLGKPDLTIPVKPIFIPGNYEDRFLLIKVPFEVPKDSFIRAVEFVPGNTKVVHHVNGDMVRFETDLKKNVNDGAYVSDMKLDSTIGLAYKNIGILHDDGSYPTLVKSVVNYLPGVIAQQYPDGIGGWKIHQKNAFLLADLHYGPSVEETWDSSFIHVFYARVPPQRPIKEFQMGTLGVSGIEPPLVLLPNKVQTHYSRYTLPNDISVLTINPHMHLLGKSFKAYALKPDGDTIRMISIPRWDFNWQYFYTFPKMLHIPAGSTIVMEGVFDNTLENPLNPFHPPQTIRDNNGSMKTTDEMFQLIISYLPYQKGDENISLKREN